MATFSKQDFLKYDSKYLKMVLSDILNNKKIKIGPQGKESKLILTDCDAIIALKQSQNFKNLESKFTGRNPAFQFETSDHQKISWSGFFKGSYSTKSNISTQIQETISAKLCELALQDKPFSSDIIFKLFPKCDPGWFNSFQKQFEIFKQIKSKFNLQGNYIVRREMPCKEILQSFLKRFGKYQKDEWNPADIWIIKDPQKLNSILKKINFLNLEQLNLFFCDQLKEGNLIGISLKKIKGVPKFQILNYD